MPDRIIRNETEKNALLKWRYMVSWISLSQEMTGRFSGTYRKSNSNDCSCFNLWKYRLTFGTWKKTCSWTTLSLWKLLFALWKGLWRCFLQKLQPPGLLFWRSTISMELVMYTEGVNFKIPRTVLPYRRSLCVKWLRLSIMQVEEYEDDEEWGSPFITQWGAVCCAMGVNAYPILQI